MHRIAKTLPPIAQCLRWWRYARDLLPLWLASPEQTPYGFRLRTPRYRNMVMDVYERDEISSFGQTIASRGIDMLLDVGANVGVYSCYALSKGVRTLAFEPVARNLRYLYRNVIDNGWAERCEVWPMAVSGRPGLRVFYDGARGASASLIAGWAGSDKRFAAVAPCTTLDLAVGTRFPGRPAVHQNRCRRGGTGSAPRRRRAFETNDRPHLADRNLPHRVVAIQPESGFPRGLRTDGIPRL